MPDMKEKLVELLTDCEAKGFWSYGKDCKTGEHGGHEMIAEDIADYLVENIVDAVEVVRCKDCKHYGWEQEPCHGRTQRFCKLHKGLVVVDRDTFCSYGERRTE